MTLRSAAVLPLFSEDAVPRVVEAFHAMWKNFPDPMMLVRRDRTIVAVNDACGAQQTQPGTKCWSYNPDPTNADRHHCNGCRANEALRTQKTIAFDLEHGGKRIRGYWIPVPGAPELFLHGYSSLDPIPTPPVAP